MCKECDNPELYERRMAELGFAVGDRVMYSHEGIGRPATIIATWAAYEGIKHEYDNTRIFVILDQPILRDGKVAGSRWYTGKEHLQKMGPTFDFRCNCGQPTLKNDYLCQSCSEEQNG